MMFTRVKFQNDDDMMVSMAPREVKIIKMRFGGTIPGETLAKIETKAQTSRATRGTLRMAQDMVDRMDAEALLDQLTEKVMGCESAEDVKRTFGA